MELEKYHYLDNSFALETVLRPLPSTQMQITIAFLAATAKIFTKPAEASMMAFATDTKTSTLNMRLLGTERDTTSYRWTAWDQPGNETAWALGSALDSSRTLEIRDGGTGAVLGFSFPAIRSNSDASDTIRRGGKEAIHTRDQASRTTNSMVL